MRKLSLTLALCLLLSILTGCGSESPGTTAPAQTMPTQNQTQPTEPTVPPTEPPPGADLFRMELPEGYTLAEETEDRFVFVSPNAPEDPSTITVELLPVDETVLTMSNTSYKKRIDVTKQEGSEALRFRLREVRNDVVDGDPCVVSEYNVVYEDYITRAYRYEVVTGTANVVFIFSDATDDNDWLDTFAECAETIELVRGGDIGVDYSALARYDLDCGLLLFAQHGLVEHDARDFTACLGSRSAIILFMADHKEANNLTGMALEDYAQLLRENNDLGSFARDGYGNLYTSFYSTDESGTEYFNMLFVKETGDAFWVCQMACVAELQEQYEEEFPLWASSITQN